MDADLNVSFQWIVQKGSSISPEDWVTAFTKRSKTCIKKIDEVNHANSECSHFKHCLCLRPFGFLFVETECNFICALKHPIDFMLYIFFLQSKSSPSTLSSMAAWLEFSLAPYRPCSWLSATTNPHTRTGLHPQVTNQIGWCWRYYMPKSVQRLGSVNESNWSILNYLYFNANSCFDWHKFW